MLDSVFSFLGTGGVLAVVGGAGYMAYNLYNKSTQKESGKTEAEVDIHKKQSMDTIEVIKNISIATNKLIENIKENDKDAKETTISITEVINNVVDSVDKNKETPSDLKIQNTLSRLTDIQKKLAAKNRPEG